MYWTRSARSNATAVSAQIDALPGAFRRIRLELARAPGHPVGSRPHSYVFVAPLDASGRLDPRLWKEHHDECRVVRFRSNNEDVGHLIHKTGGGWAFHYDIHGDGAEETGFRFADERFAPGESVSIKEGREVDTFRVLAVDRL